MALKELDRRLRTRFRIRLPFVLKINSQEVRGFTRNLSLLGISAYTRQSISPVEAVQCFLELPKEAHPVVATGTVIRCQPLSEAHPDGSYEMGVFFKGFQANGEAAVARFLSRIEREEQAQIKAGFEALKKRLAARKRRKKLEILRKKRRRQERLRRRRQRLLRLKRKAAQRRRKGRPGPPRRAGRSS